MNLERANLTSFAIFHDCRRYPNVGSSVNLTIPSEVQLQKEHNDHVVIDNGIVQVNLTKPGGAVSSIRYNGIDNVLERRNEEEDRGYWDLDWYEPEQEQNNIHDRIAATEFKVIIEDPEQVELSFVRTWDGILGNNSIALNIDIRFVVLRGCPGLYSYAIYEHLEGWPDFDLAQTRIVFKLDKDKFHYMALSDDRQKTMPMPEDRDTGQPLAYKEAVLLTNPTNPALKGEVDDKYLFSCHNKDCKVHGWISNDSLVGFWTITPSNEFQSGGPLKQDLTSHVGPITLSMFHSQHYGGADVALKFRDGEYWRKVYGPVLFYLNAVGDVEEEDPYLTLWEDAKEQMMIEVESWPYSFPASEDYALLEDRGTVSGRLLVLDRYQSEDYIPGDSAYVGLALPGDVGSWQREGKGYQFWTQADADGYFSITNVRSGDYNLYAYVPSFIGDYKYDVTITITPGSDLDTGVLVFEPLRNGPTLWEIGIPDRSAAEFYIPDPKPYITRLYLSHPNSDGNPSTPVDKFRQYGLWEKYTELYPDGDLIYVVDISDYSNSWFYAHVPRKTNGNTSEPTTWQVIFVLDSVDYNTGNYTFRLALASAAVADLHVRVNELKVDPLFSTGIIGRDSAIARHGIHGLYWLFNIGIPANLLTVGFNTIYLTQSLSKSPFEGVMYDYLRLEGPYM
ncbi:rhamnogalacturonan endolyase [Ranunculus cassubicifolius]